MVWVFEVGWRLWSGFLFIDDFFIIFERKGDRVVMVGGFKCFEVGLI